MYFLKADLITGGKGGRRVEYFDSDKRFIQDITNWKPLREYSFNQYSSKTDFKIFSEIPIEIHKTE